MNFSANNSDAPRYKRHGLKTSEGQIAYQLALPFGLDEVTAEEEEQLLYRTFRRALKARVMTTRDRLPIQLANNHLFEDGPNKDDPATRAWSVSVGIFYKAGGIPWSLAHTQPHVCFVGVSFHKLHTTKRQAMYASMAEAFSTDIEGFVLRGERIPWREDQQPYLTSKQAAKLGGEILKEYYERAGLPPVRITLHKTTLFAPEEQEGFREAFSDVPVLELLTLQPTDFRLFTSEHYPPRRGTLCSLNGTKHFLYTTGFFGDWGTYPGPHVPEPLQVIPASDGTDLRRICEETMDLTKMNWNSASIGGRDPITLHMAREVGPIMAEVPEDEWPELSYRYYM